MIGHVGSLNLHAKNFAGTVVARRYPVQKHRPVRLEGIGTRGKGNMVIESCFEIHADAVSLAGLHDWFAHRESLRDLVERQCGKVEAERRLGFAKQELDISWIYLSKVVSPI